MTWDRIISWLPTLAVVLAVVVALYMVRRFRPAGLGAAVTAPVSVVSQFLGHVAQGLRGLGDRSAGRSRRDADNLWPDATHRLGRAIAHTLLAALWFLSMVLLLRRNANVVLEQYREAVAAGVTPPAAGMQLVGLAQVFGPILLTAVAGIMVFELCGFTHHFAFLHRERRLQKAALLAFVLVILAVTMISQYSVARQEALAARAEAFELIELERSRQVPPLPLAPTAEEAAAFANANSAFDRTVAAPRMEAVDAANGPIGWRTWLPIVGALVDFVLAFAVVPTVIIAWVLVLRVIGGGALLVRRIIEGTAFLVRLVGGAAMSVLGLEPPPQQAAPAVVSPQPGPPAGAAPHPPVGEDRRRRPPWAAPSPNADPGPATTAGAPTEDTTVPAGGTDRWTTFAGNRRSRPA
jgi:hypothetical protein